MGSEQEFYRWRVFVDSSDTELIGTIEYVEYELHPSIPNPYRPVADRNSKFALTFNSWGSFTLRGTVIFKNGTKDTFVYWLNENNPFPEDKSILHQKGFNLKTTSFFREKKQKEFWEKNPRLEGVKLYDIRAIVDSKIPGALEKVDHVEYFLPGYPKDHQNPIRDNYKDKFLLKELAYGGSTLYAKVYLKGEKEPIELLKSINLEEKGPRFIRGYIIQPNADLISANLSKTANLIGADLTGANLTGADLSEADISEANLTGADLTGANLKGADLTGANLGRANLTEANLEGAKLDRAYMVDALLGRASLKDSNLKGANLARANLKGAKIDEKCIETILKSNGWKHAEFDSDVKKKLEDLSK